MIKIITFTTKKHGRSFKKNKGFQKEERVFI